MSKEQPPCHEAMTRFEVFQCVFVILCGLQGIFM